MNPLAQEHWNLLFLEARTHSGWVNRSVDDDTLRRLYEIVRMGPTSSNCQPLRVIFVKSPQAKERLRPCLDAGNVEKTMQAPVTAVLAYDDEFYSRMGKLAPHRPDLGARIASRPAAKRQEMAIQSATLQIGYLIVAARGLGLDCGPMAGFDSERINTEFFPDGKLKSILLVNLGYGDASKLHPRAPRLEFSDACQLL